MPGGERSLWVHWEAPLAPVVAYVLEWQWVTAEPGHCSTCWQMEHDGAATTALIQGKRGLPGDPDPLATCPRGLAPILTKSGPSPAPSPPPTLPPSSGSTPRVGGLVPWGTGRGSWGSLSSQCPELPAPLLSIVDGIEPFQRYNISLYPLYEDTVGVPIHTTAYSQQKGTWEGCPTTKTLPFQKEEQPLLHVPLIQGLCQRPQLEELDLSHLRRCSRLPHSTGRS